MIPLRTKMIGDHHLSNCLLVAAAALALGIDLPTVVRGLEAVENVPFRMERIECGQPFSMFVDSADSPDRLAACLRAARQVAAGRVICVANADGAMPNEHRPLIGRILEKGTDIGLTTTSGYSPEPPLQAIHDVIDGYHRPAKAHAMPDRDQAIAWALSQAQPGDCVLIAGCTGQPSQRADGSSIDDAEFALQIVLADQQEAAEPKILRMLGD